MDNRLLVPIIAIAVFVIIPFLFLMYSVCRPWLRACLSGGHVPLMSVIGMRLRKSPAMLLVDTYLMMLHGGEQTSIRTVESVYLANKDKVTDAESLAELVRDEIAEKGFDAL
ncbi:MAG: flotillin-like FloA family protein [Planctomycetota bacterium]|jgi:uncharacterized protein YqfA (UPF0365 family)